MSFDSSLKASLDKLDTASHITRESIPDILLYIEQVTAYLDNKIDPAYKTDDTAFTKTMINNYTKAGVLPRPLKKKYSSEHIMRLVEIYMLKQLFSFAQIEQLFSSDSTDQALVYDTFEEISKSVQSEYIKSVKSISLQIDQKLEGKNTTDDTKLHLFALLLAFECTLGKQTCLDLIKENAINNKPPV